MLSASDEKEAMVSPSLLTADAMTPVPADAMGAISSMTLAAPSVFMLCRPLRSMMTDVAFLADNSSTACLNSFAVPSVKEFIFIYPAEA